MPKMLVGLFETPDGAQNVLQNLISRGFAREDLRVMRLALPKVPSQDLFDGNSGLSDALARAGVPASDVRHYAEQLHRGRALVIVRLTVTTTPRAIEIMAKHGVLDVSTHHESGWANQRGAASQVRWPTATTRRDGRITQP